MEIGSELDRLMAMLNGEGGGGKQRFCGTCGCPEEEKDNPNCPTIEVTVRPGMLDHAGWLKEEWLKD